MNSACEGRMSLFASSSQPGSPSSVRRPNTSLADTEGSRTSRSGHSFTFLPPAGSELANASVGAGSHPTTGAQTHRGPAALASAVRRVVSNTAVSNGAGGMQSLPPDSPTAPGAALGPSNQRRASAASGPPQRRAPVAPVSSKVLGSAKGRARR